MIDSDILQDADLHLFLTRELGAIRKVTSVGLSAKTCIVETEGATVVAKRMEYIWDPRKYAQLFDRLTDLPAPPCPRFLKSVELNDYWYAVFAYAEGDVPRPTDPQWDSIWQDAFLLLERLRDLAESVPEWDLNAIWLERLSRFNFLHPPARRLMHHLLQAPLDGPRTLAHGDFSAQNLLCTSDGLILLDWEEIGTAPMGFDAGWLLALNRVGSGPRHVQRQVFQNLAARGFPEGNLCWFEGLGLLRLLYRAMTLPIDDIVRTFIVTRLYTIISDYVDEGSGQARMGRVRARVK
jgi:aminoglycoside phosphotransferase (APT) family kinase protein